MIDFPRDQLLPILVGIGVVVAVLIGFYLLGRNRTSGGRAGRPGGRTMVRSSDWEFPAESFANRRSSVRREGAPVKVILSSPGFKTGTVTGYVVDRSTGGLRMVTNIPLTPGGSVMVRTTNAPDTIPWVTLLIRSCRPNGKYHEIGCEFDQTPPWSVLLLFG